MKQGQTESEASLASPHVVQGCSLKGTDLFDVAAITALHVTNKEYCIQDLSEERMVIDEVSCSNEGGKFH